MIVGFFPISISLVIALETFVGEKERRSLEPLLSTPLTNTELYIGKMLAAMIPPLLSSYCGMLVYLGSLIFGGLEWRPPAALVIQILMLTTVQALVMVAGPQLFQCCGSERHPRSVADPGCKCDHVSGA